MFENFLQPWMVLIKIANFFVPILVLAALMSICASYAVVERADQQVRNKTRQAQLNYFSFCSAGAMFGFIIFFLGGFKVEGATGDTFKVLGALATSFVAVSAVFWGELKLESNSIAKPLGTALSVVMMLIGFFYCTEFFK